MVEQFDKIRNEEVWNSLNSRDVSIKIIIISEIYNRNTNAIILNNRQSKTFKTTIGLRQGGSLRPNYFKYTYKMQEHEENKNCRRLRRLQIKPPDTDK